MKNLKVIPNKYAKFNDLHLFDDYNGSLLDKRNLSGRKEYFARGREARDIRHLNLLTMFEIVIV